MSSSSGATGGVGTAPSAGGNKGPRLLFVRHAHRTDRFIKDAYPSIKCWTDKCVQKKGSYVPFNVELPMNLPKRSSLEAYLDDPPITLTGELCSQLLGNRIAEIGLIVDLMYSSPSTRCVNTCYRMWQGYTDYSGPNDVKIRIDGGLYEWGSIATGPVNFEEPKFFYERGMPIDMDYKNSIEQEELRHQIWEAYGEFAKRGLEWVKKIIKNAGPNVDTIVLLTHAPTLIILTRELLKKPLNEETLDLLINNPAYIATLLLEQDNSGKWFLPSPQPLPNFEIRAKPSFNRLWLNKCIYESSRLP